MIRRYGPYILLCLISTFVFVGRGYSAPVSADQLSILEQQAKERRLQHQKLQKQAGAIQADLKSLNTKLIDAARQLQKDETSATEAEEKLRTLEADLADAEEKFSVENGRLADVLSALQNLALHPTHSLLVMPLTPVEVVRSAVLMRESVPYLNANAEKIKKDLDELTKKQKDVTAQIAKLEKQKKTLTQRQKELKKLVDQKTALRQKIEGESQKTKEEATKLAAEASDLRDLLEKAEREQELRRRKAEALRRAAAERGEAERRRLEEEQLKRIRNGESEGFQQIKDIPSAPTSADRKAVNFAGAYGKLVKPAAGTSVTAYGEELSKGVTSKGLVLKTRAGAQVVAPYDGTVIFSGPFKGYGNLIIMEHGQGYVSLLAGMSAVDTENGQMVLAGEPVGVMPDQESAKLYIEIRKNQHPVNPAPWFGYKS